MSESELDDFYKLDAWQKSHQLALKIYKLTKNFPSDERFGLTSQIRRAVTSVSANIAEGFGRFHFADKSRFYYNARGSLKEVQNFIFLTKDLEYLDPDEAKDTWSVSKDAERLINGLIRSADNQKQ